MRRLREFYCVSNCIGLSSPEKEEKSVMLAGRTKAVNAGFNCSAQEFSVIHIVYNFKKIELNACVYVQGPKVAVCCQSYPNLLVSEPQVRADCVKKNTMKAADLEVVHNDYIFNK
jgi:hypothetical protein